MGVAIAAVVALLLRAGAGSASAGNRNTDLAEEVSDMRALLESERQDWESERTRLERDLSYANPRAEQVESELAPCVDAAESAAKELAEAVEAGAAEALAAAQAPPVAQAPVPLAGSPSPNVYYACRAAARAAGAAPVYTEQPGCGTHLDRDRDGIGCE